jgi:hypothetical protein
VDDIKAVAARFSGPEFQERRQAWSKHLSQGWSSQIPSNLIHAPFGRQTMIRWCRLAIVLNPANDMAYNQLAWAMASVPADPWFNPKEALKLARKAVELNPNHWFFWNTLGVAAYRVRDWRTASDYLEKSIVRTGGDANNCFFLAMTRWQQGKRREAQQLYQQAIDWIQRNREDDELRRFHAEAAAMLGLPGPDSKPEAVAGESDEARDKKPTKSTHREATVPDQPAVELNKGPAILGSQAPAPREPPQEPLSTREDDFSTAGQTQSGCCDDDRRDPKSSPRSAPVAHH